MNTCSTKCAIVMAKYPRWYSLLCFIFACDGALPSFFLNVRVWALFHTKSLLGINFLTAILKKGKRKKNKKKFPCVDEALFHIKSLLGINFLTAMLKKRRKKILYTNDLRRVLMIRPLLMCVLVCVLFTRYTVRCRSGIPRCRR